LASSILARENFPNSSLVWFLIALSMITEAAVPAKAFAVLLGVTPLAIVCREVFWSERDQRRG
jgi:hypothetical protein